MMLDDYDEAKRDRVTGTPKNLLWFVIFAIKNCILEGFDGWMRK